MKRDEIGAGKGTEMMYLKSRRMRTTLLPLMTVALTLVCVWGGGGVASAQAPVTGAADPEALFTSRDPQLHVNKQAVLHIVRDLLEAGHWSDAPKYLTARYIQHNPNVASGREPVMRFFAGSPQKPLPSPTNWRTQVVSVVAENDLVVVATVRVLPLPNQTGDAPKTYTTTWFDMWRIKDGKADEHWDGATLPAPPPAVAPPAPPQP